MKQVSQDHKRGRTPMCSTLRTLSRELQNTQIPTTRKKLIAPQEYETRGKVSLQEAEAKYKEAQAKALMKHPALNKDLQQRLRQISLGQIPERLGFNG